MQHEFGKFCSPISGFGLKLSPKTVLPAFRLARQVKKGTGPNKRRPYKLRASLSSKINSELEALVGRLGRDCRTLQLRAELVKGEMPERFVNSGSTDADVLAP